MARQITRSTPAPALQRRDWLRLSSLGMLGAGAAPWFAAVAEEASRAAPSGKRCVLLWMAGGPSQTDTFDMKPGHANGGEFKEASTRTPGLRWSEHLPRLAEHSDKLAIVRSLSTKEGDHGRGAYLMRTGQTPGGPLRLPAIGSSLSKALGNDRLDLPNYVSIGANAGLNPAAFSPGFLGPRYAAAPVGLRRPASDNGDAAEESAEETGSAAGVEELAELGIDFLSAPAEVSPEQGRRRMEIWNSLQRDFLREHAAANAEAHDTVYRRAVRMMRSDAREAFELEREPDAVRRAYGPSLFGQGCLLARRLIERGVAFVEVTLGGLDIGWDTHADNFARTRALSQQLDAGWSALLTELEQRGLLASTTILWMGEFGRTPRINDGAGRDHFPQAWSCALAGGGIQGGQAYGSTSESGEEVVEGKVDAARVLATFCQAAGVAPETENITGLGRPIKIADAEPIKELLVS